jgi:hypothetical protein
LKPKRESGRKDSIRVEVKRKHVGESERRFISEGEKEHLVRRYPGNARSSFDKDRMGVKTLGWWVMKLETETAEFGAMIYY